MSYKLMNHLIWQRARYAWRSYVLFSVASFLFLVIYFMMLIQASIEEIGKAQNMFFIAFMYCVAPIGKAIEPCEYSKCYYLVPKTEQERKRFVRYQNLVKMIISFIVCTIVLVIGMLLRPEVKQYLISSYLMGGCAFILVNGVCGYSSFYVSKRKSYAIYLIKYWFTVVAMCLIMSVGQFSGFFLSKKHVMWLTIATLLCSIIYHIYYRIRYRKANVIYENINKEEKRLCKSMFQGLF